MPPAPPDREGLDNRNLELLLAFTLREDTNCLDIGANEGRFLWHIARLAPRGHHVAFEPLPEMAHSLRVNFPGVEVHEAALAAQAGEAEFVRVHDDPGYSGLRERDYPAGFRTERIPVRVERLDDVLDPARPVGFVKIDVEGGELGVLQGGLEMLRRDRPVVAFEHGPGAADRYGTTPEQVWDLLAGEIGLRIFDMDGDGPLDRARFTEVFHSGRRWNYVARP